MGIHTGEPQLTREGYVGLDVHAAARIAASGHGGQVVVSDRSRELSGGQAAFTDLGEHRLKDLPDEVRLFQLGTDMFPRFGVSARRTSRIRSARSWDADRPWPRWPSS